MCSDIDHVKTSISNHSALTIPEVTDLLFLLCGASSRWLGVFYESTRTRRKSLSLLQSVGINTALQSVSDWP